MYAFLFLVHLILNASRTDVNILTAKISQPMFFANCSMFNYTMYSFFSNSFSEYILFLVPHDADPTHAVIVVHRLMSRQHTDFEGHHHCHAAMNDIIHRTLTSAKVPSRLEPSRLEPSGIHCSDGKRPDGITTIPWRNGKLLVWDATSPDTFAPLHVSKATSEAGAVAALAEDRKRTKYTCLEPTYTFTPIAIETSGVFGPLTLQLLKDPGN